jgi:hypothetical protein
MTTKDILLGLKPITLDCLTVFAPFYAERAKHYVYPRYMQSVCALVGFGKTYYNIVNAENGKVLAIYKRTAIFGKTGVQMPVCPISLSGSVRDELSVMSAALKVGVSLRVTSEDIARYRIPPRLCSDGTCPFVPVNNEYIYQAQQGAEMKGAKYYKLRHKVKRVLTAEGFSLTDGAHPQADAVVRAWDARYKKINGTQTDQAHLWQIIKQALVKGQTVSVRNITVGGVLQCVSVTEQISPKHYVGVFRVRNYNSTLHDVVSAMQQIDCNACLGSDNAPVYMNRGLADTEGLIALKESLRPCRHQKIFTVKTQKTSQSLKQYFI